MEKSETATYITVNKDIDADLTQEVVEACIKLHQDTGTLPLVLIMNSNGGEIDATMNIIEALRKIKKKRQLFTVNIGAVGSAALDIYMEGNERFCMKNGTFTLHKSVYNPEADVNAVAMLKKAKELQQLDKFTDTWVRKQRFTKAQLRDYKAGKDVEFNRKQAIRAKVVTKNGIPLD